MTTEQESRLLALLESGHRFPGPFTFKVIVRAVSGLAEELMDVICAKTGVVRPGSTPVQRSSAGGKFVSISMEFELSSSQDVLAVYAVLRDRDDIVAYF